MSQPAIQVEGLGKKYIISHKEGVSYNALRDVITEKAKNFFKHGNSQPSREEFWALKDINFEVQQGEAIGIIGRNGSGKSTLLKILSRITEPTKGNVRINGRVASLLEVGTGFHPELSGRENIFLNGAILGMNRTEIKNKFDAIVDFSGVEKFLDTPVKRYSSGMYVRLAFAVAAHLEPEILLVDEVLAVGDAEFQKKCLGKMDEVSRKEGRTVLFVSHNMAVIKQVCTRGLLLKNGLMVHYGAMDEVVDHYLSDIRETFTIPVHEREDRIGNQKLKFSRVIIKNASLEPASIVQNGASCYFELSFEQRTGSDELKDVHFSVGINDPMGNRILLLSSYLTGQNFNIAGKNSTVLLRIDHLPLKAGNYSYTISCGENSEVYDAVRFAGEFEVEEGNFFRTGKELPPNQGYIMIPHSFSIEEQQI